MNCVWTSISVHTIYKQACLNMNCITTYFTMLVTFVWLSTNSGIYYLCGTRYKLLNKSLGVKMCVHSAFGKGMKKIKFKMFATLVFDSLSVFRHSLVLSMSMKYNFYFRVSIFFSLFYFVLCKRSFLKIWRIPVILFTVFARKKKCHIKCKKSFPDKFSFGNIIKNKDTDLSYFSTFFYFFYLLSIYSSL